ncbi:MAG: aldolase/citrate lyase family protein [Methylacidiphilales bacterium]|nr:aldolase/citrate lyase family protein [Candidatus Methylacidiphilales bacterium]
MNEWNNKFKLLLNQKPSLVGGWLMSGSPIIAELLSYVGYDYIVIDVEHGSAQPYVLGDLIRAIESNGTVAIVRLQNHNETVIKQALDAGAMNLLFPFIQTVEQAQSIVQSALYPPQGRRGYAMMHRGSRFATREHYFSKINQELGLYAQLETKSAIDSLISISAVEGISGVFIGPGDLSVDLGFAGNTQHPEVLSIMKQVGLLCKQKKISLGTVVANSDSAVWAFECGYRFVSIGNDLANIKNKSLEQIKQFR